MGRGRGLRLDDNLLRNRGLGFKNITQLILYRGRQRNGIIGCLGLYHTNNKGFKKYHLRQR